MITPYDPQGLYNALKELQVISDERLDAAWKESKETQSPFDNVIVQKDLLSDENVGQMIAELLSVSYVSVSSVPIPESVTYLIPEDYARMHQVIAFSDEQEQIKVAMTNPHDKAVLAMLQKKSGKPILPYYTTQREIERAFRAYKKSLQGEIDILLKTESGAELQDMPITQIVDTLISFAYQGGASDIHIEPEKDVSNVRFRIDGIMHNILRIMPEVHKQIISRIKVLSKLRTDDHFSAQDGKMQVQLKNEALDMRVSIVPIAHGENCVIRLLASQLQQFSLQDLGMTVADLEKVSHGFTKPHGTVMATGPTGSGKSSTIYAILKILNTQEQNIATIEDPIEYDIAGINQIQVNVATNLTFADGLRAILRQDPDIIYVGEIRDSETADIAINAALTGHLVFSTLHTNDAPTAFPRLIDMGVEPFLVASTVNVIIAQRLVRKICTRCKVSYVVPFSDLSKYFSLDKIPASIRVADTCTLYKGKGCEVCHTTGYAGRIGIFEVLEISDAIRHLITTKATSDEIGKQAKAEGMTTMMDNGLQKLLAGITTIEEILRTTRT